jgi:hypothetical protein
MRPVQPPGGGVVTIALLGHRQRHDRDLRRGHGLDDGGRILGCHEDIGDHVNDPHARAPGRQFHRRVKPALRRKPVAGGRAFQTDGEDAPRLTRGRCRLLGKGGAEGAEERAGPQMHDTGGRGLALTSEPFPHGSFAGHGFCSPEYTSSRLCMKPPSGPACPPAAARICVGAHPQQGLQIPSVHRLDLS